MSFDEFFVNGDKPYAENLNDSVLLANALDFKVIVTAPDQFSNGSFLDTVVKRKCGVCTMRLSESLPDGVSVTGGGYLSFTGVKSVEFFVYPNFNQFGAWRSISWTCDDDLEDNITVDLLTKEGDVILSDIGNGTPLSSDVELSKLDEIIVKVSSVDDVVLTGLVFEYSKRNTINIEQSSVRILNYSTTDEMNTAILTAVLPKANISEVYSKLETDALLGLKVNISDLQELIHNELKDVFTGKAAEVTIVNGKLTVKKYEESDL